MCVFDVILLHNYSNLQYSFVATLSFLYVITKNIKVILKMSTYKGQIWQITKGRQHCEVVDMDDPWIDRDLG